MHYSKIQKIFFYLALAYYKLFSFAECQNNHMVVLINEFKFLLYTLGFRQLNSKTKTKILLKTKLGSFYIRNIEIDINIASPSYERQDINELIQLIGNLLKTNHHVLFLDIGACFGKYTIAIGSAFKQYGNNLKIMAFEPNKQNYNLLKENVRLNKINNVVLYNYALSDKNEVQNFYYYQPMRQIVSFPTPKPLSIKAIKLDQILKAENLKSDLVVKMDIEGNEIKALKGGATSLKNRTILLIEDSFSNKQKELLTYLSKYGKFLTKKTPYNSFWKL